MGRVPLWQASRGQHSAAGRQRKRLVGAVDKELTAPTLANVRIRSLATEDACRRGCRYYDFGESGESVSPTHWKSGFGAEAHPNTSITWNVSQSQLSKGIIKRLMGFKDA